MERMDSNEAIVISVSVYVYNMFIYSTLWSLRYHPLGWVPRVSFISRFYCIPSTRLGPKSVLYVQVLLYTIH